MALLAIGALMFGGLFSYQFGDGNLMGPVGRLVAAALYAGFGMAAYLIVLGVLGIGIKALLGRRMELNLGEGVGFSSATLAGCVLLHVMFPTYRVHGYTAGGLSGELLGEVSIGLFELAGTYLITITVMTLGLIASTPLSFEHLLRGARTIGRGGYAVARYLYSGVVGIVQAQREYAEQTWTEADEGEVDSALDDEDEEAWEALEAEAEAAELEAEEAAEAEEEAPEVEAVASKKKSRRKGAKATASKGKRARKNTKRANERKASAAVEEGALELEEEEEEEESEAELEEDAEVEGEGDEDEEYEYEYVYEYEDEGEEEAGEEEEEAAEEEEAEEDRPEICVSEEPDLDVAGPSPETEEGGEDESGEGEGEEAGEGDDAKGGKARKKAPLTPAEIAARARAKRAEAAAATAATAPAAVKREGAQPVSYINGSYELPPLHLFAAVEKAKAKIDKDFIYEQAERIVEAFAHFKIRGKVTKIHPGPVITRYEFKPEAGVKVSRIQNLENDLAMALEAIRIRILAPIPGKSTVGLEVPNKERETVYVQENLADAGYHDAGHRLPLVLGKDIVGKSVSIDLGKAPHLLVAGATGSGKSVGVNAMLCSLLYSCTPEELRLILIDPKMLEFSIYRDIPHLLLPVITDAEKANLALRWAVNEMERRYALLSEAKVRDIKGYNKKVPQLQAEWDAESKALEAEAAALSAEAVADGEDSVNGAMLSGVQFDAQGNAVAITGGVELPARPESMPYIVTVIDEFADLMMVASKEVEANVARLAAKARAAGIHLILATQRPSVDVITGTIKNNFPSRIAFQVTSDVDSRTILDQKGAKQLLGMGDMLYMDRGKEPRRVHGCFVSEAEIEKVVEFVRKQAKPAYNMEITKAEASESEGEDERPEDPLYDKAVQVVADAQKVSTSMLQRRLNVGYNRAAKIVERMEEEGVIGPANGSKPREVYVAAA
ncbi:DNA translocase FtsK 4TM domain-containing protein [Pseudenhygromyxa sp. WMMC2535]|uniref:DNA translocase FtsK 4TM domain-containing protein n=1 Tax=Pseudenhygromyxa sp. WMMC2535 TaxID=2712867 RepID=UPI001552D6CF|nr:DNA translocase FtsK 4TM domain-containing protein [Pseudenhygromyxa sp. WMMC2535]